ncbi:hypothetical protein BC643_2439 [Mangrovibacterium diazotrophicum]|uniref:Uncharacterized protein n=1 Tax=Mangrovibacterium diazotrophicum TaxID=1261403 RepID=A0A419W9E6_9BACT|nr:hypothetical protein BC643_2439 [Mangrovibacterium diazotrophicum]
MILDLKSLLVWRNNVRVKVFKKGILRSQEVSHLKQN